MAECLIYFHQQWVGDHTDEWFRGRGPLARMWPGKIAEACGRPQEVRRFKPWREARG